MKKKTLLLSAAACGLMAVSLASCGETKKANLKGSTIDVYINYCGAYGPTFTGLVSNYKTYKNPVDNKTYSEGDLLPVWEQLQTTLECTIKDAAWSVDQYQSVKDDAQETALKSYEKFNELDIVMMSNANANKFAADGKLLNINKYLNYMPNYKAFLDANPSIKSEMTNADGQMFMLPYFDGLNSPEHLFIMNTELVEALLDSENTNDFDTAAAAETAYSAFLDTASDYKVSYSDGGKLKTLNVKGAKNPVTAQNELTAKNGKTYADALRNYIDTAYMQSNVYTKRSEVFTSEKACYNTDDLIALMRVAVNNPTYVSTKFGCPASVQGFIPREGADSRIDSVLWLSQIWGVQGIRGMAEKDALYFDKDGKLQDGRVTAKNYDALEKLHQLYTEGLIISAFDSGDKTKYNSQYLTGKQGAALLMFDYNATQTVMNQVDENGIGTKDSKFKGVMPVLPPLSKWENDTITDSQYKYSRYLESSRANKGSGTVIPLHADDQENINACAFADYFFSKEGSLLQDYGPEAYRDGEFKVGNQTFPAYSKTVIDEVNKFGGWNNYCRMALGATQGIGHVRTDGVELQFTNAAGRVGASNLSLAVESGAVISARSDRQAGFAAAVPSQWSGTVESTEIAVLENFWKRGTGDSAWREVVLKGWAGASTKRADLEALFGKSNEIYLTAYRNLLEVKNS
ncbi:MAG: hypothetical protein NC087_03470 [Anaeroplasma bactoclasticum]|nr:hypothetical protein [Anaeroplasma bactoclasticum]MCM1556573.1 hypothetical protein [Anaeroplasma bactoclasticum]